MESPLSTCYTLLLLLLLFSSSAWSQEGIAEMISHNLILPSQDGVYFVTEGSSFSVCCPRTGIFSGYDEIRVILSERTMVNGDSFDAYIATISSEENCTTISATQDADYERSKVFNVLLQPVISRDPEDEDKGILESQGSSGVSYTLILEDDEGSSIECSRNFVDTKDITAVFQQRNSCAASAANLFGQCDQARSFLDCTRWNPELVPLLDSPDSDSLFPIVEQEFRAINTSQSCVEWLKSHLVSSFTDSGAQDKCYSNCTATLSNGCSVSVFVLENVDSRRIGSPETLISPQCGVFNVTCCGVSQCLSPPTSDEGLESSLPIPAIVGGAVGAVVAIAATIILAVMAGVILCVVKRKKKQKQRKKSPSTLVQSIVYKPKRMESSGGISQGSTVASTAPLTREGGDSRPITPVHPNYEEVVYTESYSKWKKHFAKVMIDTEDIEYGDLIGEGEFSNVFKADYTRTGGSVMQVAVKKLKTISDNKEIEKFIAESAIMMDFNHPNILHLIGVCFNSEDNLPSIVLPYMAKGDLRSFLRAKRATLITSDAKEDYPQGLSEAAMVGMCMDIARGMHYLSKCKLVHRDLAARNCMVDDKMIVKVADFGLSRDIHLSNYYRLTHRQKMPVKWMAPESLFKKLYNEKTDVWSYGIVCWEVFKLGKKPYAGIDNPDLPNYISHGFRPKKPSRCPSELFKLMKDTWREDPEERPDFRAIVLSLANLLHYSGDIESDLAAETKHCNRDHIYHQLEPSVFPSKDHQETSAHMYSELEEQPLYHNCSRDESLGSPEQYEVPQPLSTGDDESEESLEVLDNKYEVPVVSSEDAESVAAGALVPMEYEVPQSGASETATNPLPDKGSSPSRLPQRSPAQRRKKPATLASTKNGSSPRHKHPSHNSKPATKRVIPNEPDPAISRSPAHRSPWGSPARHHKPPATGPVNIPGAKGRDGLEMSSPSRRGDRAISPGYLKLSYPKAEGVPAPSSSDKPYSTLEWKKSTNAANFNSLPHQFTLKNHIYQTLEPKQVQVVDD